PAFRHDVERPVPRQYSRLCRRQSPDQTRCSHLHRRTVRARRNPLAQHPSLVHRTLQTSINICFCPRLVAAEKKMIADEKILITGITGVVATPLAHFLAQNNEVWGIARFQDSAVRDEYERAGITTRAVDIGAGDFSTLPNDFTYVLHLAWMRAELDELDNAIRTNVEGPGLLLQHCRKA